MTTPIRTPDPLRPCDTAVPRRTGSDDRTPTPEQANEKPIDWSRCLPIGDDEMPA